MERCKELGADREAFRRTGTFKTCPRVRDGRLGVGAGARWCAARRGEDAATASPAPWLCPSRSLSLGETSL